VPTLALIAEQLDAEVGHDLLQLIPRVLDGAILVAMSETSIVT
jgi:hypothetical protein